MALIGRWMAAVLAGVVGLLPAVAVAQNLLDFVRSDVGLCVQADGLARRIPELADAPFFRRVQEWPPCRQWRERDDRKLRRAAKGIERAVGEPLPQFLREVFGESVVLAIFPRAMAEPAGLLLLRASDDAALERAVQAWNMADGAQIETLSHVDQTYYRRTRPPRDERPAETQFYFRAGRVLGLSDREPMIRQALELAAGRSAVGPLSQSDHYAQARRVLAPDSLLTFYFNPRPWDVVFPAETPHDGPQRLIAALWRRCNAVMAGVRADRGLIVEAVAQYGNRGTPPRQQTTSTTGPAESLRHIPRHALAAAAGRTPFATIAALATRRGTLGGDQWQRARQIARGLLMGRDPLSDVLPQLGPNWCAYVVPRSQPAADAVPVDGLFAVELPPPDAAVGEETIPLREALHNALLTGMNLMAALHNSQENPSAAIVRSAEIEGAGTLRWIESLGPYRPAYLVTDEALIVASAPDLIRAHLRITPSESLSAAPDFSAWADEFFPQAGHVLFVNLVETRRFLETHHDALAQHVARSKSLSSDEAAQQLDRLRQTLTLFDGLFLAARVDDGQVRLILGGAVEPADAAPPR